MLCHKNNYNSGWKKEMGILHITLPAQKYVKTPKNPPRTNEYLFGVNYDGLKQNSTFYFLTPSFTSWLWALLAYIKSLSLLYSTVLGTLSTPHIPSGEKSLSVGRKQEWPQQNRKHHPSAQEKYCILPKTCWGIKVFNKSDIFLIYCTYLPPSNGKNLISTENGGYT